MSDGVIFHGNEGGNGFKKAATESRQATKAIHKLTAFLEETLSANAKKRLLSCATSSTQRAPTVFSMIHPR